MSQLEKPSREELVFRLKIIFNALEDLFSNRDYGTLSEYSVFVQRVKNALFDPIEKLRK